MTTNINDRLWIYWNMLRSMGNIDPEMRLTATVLLDEVKNEREENQISENPDELYRLLLSIADRKKMRNPFPDARYFYNAYMGVRPVNKIDWEQVLFQTLSDDRYPVLPEPLIKLFTEHLKKKPERVLIAEGVSFVPNLKKMVDENVSIYFTITSVNFSHIQVLQKIFEGYDNVEILEADIYKYGFINKRFDLIFALPAFGGRTLAEDTTFICREYDMVALENLSFHLNNGGQLVIILPGRITFASGKIRDLRQFIQENYTVKELAELPEGIFDYTGIKTYLLDIENSRPGDDDITIRKYSAGERKSKKAAVTELTVVDDTFILLEELEKQGDWNINRFFEMQDEEWQKYQNSDIRKDFIENVAQVFRGKSVSKKDPTGAYGVVNISNIGEYELDYDNLEHLDEDERKVSNYILKEGDLLLPARGTAIRTAVFHEQSYPCIASSNIIVIRPDERALDSTYLKVFLDSPLGNKMISSTQQGTTIMNISYKDLNVLEIPLPPIEEQQAIARTYVEELKTYKKTIETAEQRWKDVLSKLQEF
jgi:hypothetical protein